MKKTLIIIIFLSLCLKAFSQMEPETPVDQWTNKKILLIGAHPDDDSYSYGTLAMLQENGNQIHVLIMTTGNVGTKDPNLSRDDLAKIRRQEEINALADLGIPEDHYINLGYTDGMLEFADKEEVVRQLVYHIREIQPDVLFAFDPGYGYQRWRKSDHRAASYLAADAARAAEWRLLFPGQIIHDGLEAHVIPEYMFYDSVEEDVNLWVDISGFEQKKIDATSRHLSQFSSAWENYQENLPQAEIDDLKNRVKQRIKTKEGKPVEYFRYYTGIPDGIGKRQ
ncbi:MAG: PIG-L deacetylase family protein [Candidatus Cyclobacteriaceae bacterium M3_2C_046]